MIKAGDYCHIVSDKRMQGSGLTRGDVVFVTGTKVAPVTKHDPYLQRIYIHAITVNKDGTHNVPTDGNDYRVYLIDPRNVERVSEVDADRFRESLKEQYGG